MGQMGRADAAFLVGLWRGSRSAVQQLQAQGQQEPPAAEAAPLEHCPHHPSVREPASPINVHPITNNAARACPSRTPACLHWSQGSGLAWELPELPPT